MAIQMSENFKLLSKEALDGRISYKSLSEMVSMQDSYLYDGCLATIEGDATKKIYQWWSSNAIDSTLGKWRELEFNGEVPVFTQAEWNALSPEEKLGYAGKQVIISDDYDENSINYQECLTKAKNTFYWNYGSTAGLPSGLIRSGYIPKKVIMLGNSLTTHRPIEPGSPEGYVWTVYDWRAMCASTPTSDWTNLVYKKLHTINPEVVVKKAAVINWEGQTAGNRNLNSILNDESCSEIKEDGGHYLENTTIGDILTDDVDVIIWQAFENVANPASTSLNDWKLIYDDYCNVFKELREKCPKATLYAIPGFWMGYDKSKIVQTACISSKVNIIPIWNALSPYYDMSVFCADEGYEIYDADGNIICTTDSVVAGHPNDKGHILIAFYVLMNLFNGHSSEAMDFILEADDAIPETLELESMDNKYSYAFRTTNFTSYNMSELSNLTSNILFSSCIRLLGCFNDDNPLSHALLSTKVLDNNKYGSIPAYQKIRAIGSNLILERSSTRDLMNNQTWNYFQEITNYFETYDNTKIISTDWNTFTDNMRCYYDGRTTVTNAPMSVPFGMLEVKRTKICIVQQFFDFSGGKLYIRRNTGAWQGWIVFSGSDI